jgi:hypothetical protein
MIRRNPVRHSLYLTLLVPLLAAPSLHGQTPASQPDPAYKQAVDELRERLFRALLDSRYDGLQPVEKRAVAGMAWGAISIIQSGECANPDAVNNFSGTFRYLIAKSGRDSLKPVLELPDSKKNILIDDAMALAVKEDTDAEFAKIICKGRMLAASAVNPIEARRGGARHVLSIGLGLERAATPLGRAP